MRPQSPRQFTTDWTVGEVFTDLLTMNDLVYNADGSTYYGGGPTAPERT